MTHVNRVTETFSAKQLLLLIVVFGEQGMSSYISLSRSLISLSLLSAVAATNVNAQSYVPLWSEGECSSNANHGANREYYNAGAEFKWQNFQGDWLDVDGISQGATAFGQVQVQDLDQVQSIEMDILPLVQKWASGNVANQGVMLRAASGKLFIMSKEGASEQSKPKLILDTSEGHFELVVVYDTVLRGSTYLCGGALEELGSADPILLYFDLSSLPAHAVVYGAKLALTTSANQYGNSYLEAFQVNIAGKNISANSLSERYPNDFQMQYDDGVLLVESFESEDWPSNWSIVKNQENLQLVTQNAAENFEPLMGKSLQVEIGEGEFHGLNLVYLFADKIGKDVEEVYMRYYLRLGESWSVNDTGKLPGIAGTYMGESYQGGWGGRKSDGTNGWSARGVFRKSILGNNPFSGKTPIGNYVYSANQSGSYGDVYIYDGEEPGVLDKNKWYAIEQYVKMNTPGQNDGVIRSWINGKPSFEKTDLLFRDENSEFIKIDRIWMNIYHGGKIPAGQKITAFVDNVVIADSYIGPIEHKLGAPIAGDEVNRSPEITVKYPLANEMTLKVGDTMEFSGTTFDPEMDLLDVKWFVNGELQAQGETSFYFERGLSHIDEQVIEMVVTDTELAQATTSWKLTSEEANWLTQNVVKDTYLAASTYTANGFKDEILIKDNTTTLMAFTLPADLSSDAIKTAYIVLTDSEQYGDMTLEVYQGDSNWHEGAGQKDGATREYRDYASKNAWVNYLGDWLDADGIQNGSNPFAINYIEDTNTMREVAIDVTRLTKEQMHSSTTLDVVLKSKQGSHVFGSKENADASVHPRLIIELH